MERENKTCSCGGTSVFLKQWYVEGREHLFFGLDDWEKLDLYVCEDCGKVEFYRVKLEIKPAAEQLEEKYRTYPDKKLKKIAEDPEYREDARALACRILTERGK